MGSIISAIYDDIGEYEELCKHYEEEVQKISDAYGNKHPNCYGKHCRELKKRRAEDWKKRNKDNQ